MRPEAGEYQLSSPVRAAAFQRRGWLWQHLKEFLTSHPTAQLGFVPMELQGSLSVCVQKTLHLGNHGQTGVFPYSVWDLCGIFISNNQVNRIWRILTILCLGPQFVEFLFPWLPTHSTFQNCHSKTMIKMSQLSVIQVTAHLIIFPLFSSPSPPPPHFIKLSDFLLYTASWGRQAPLLLKMPTYWTNFLSPPAPK